MKYRPLGKSELLISEIGFGGWGIGGATRGATSYGPTDDKESLRALEQALDKGVNFFDTANIYGRSEHLIGQAFRNRRHKVIIASKFGFINHSSPQDFSKLNIFRSITGTLSRLQTDYVDLYQLHSPPLEQIDLDEVLECLKLLQEKGYVRFFGVSVKSPGDGLKILHYSDFAALQVNLSMIDQRAIDNRLLKEAVKKGVGIIARTPLCFGFLSGKITDLNFGPLDHRSAWPQEQLENWQKAAELFNTVRHDPAISLSQMALRFCLDTEGVSTVIPGMTNIGTVNENVRSAELAPLPEIMMRRIRRMYLENNRFRPSKVNP